MTTRPDRTRPDPTRSNPIQRIVSIHNRSCGYTQKYSALCLGSSVIIGCFLIIAYWSGVRSSTVTIRFHTAHTRYETRDIGRQDIVHYHSALFSSTRNVDEVSLKVAAKLIRSVNRRLTRFLQISYTWCLKFSYVTWSRISFTLINLVRQESKFVSDSSLLLFLLHSCLRVHFHWNSSWKFPLSIFAACKSGRERITVHFLEISKLRESHRAAPVSLSIVSHCRFSFHRCRLSKGTGIYL